MVREAKIQGQDSDVGYAFVAQSFLQSSTDLYALPITCVAADGSADFAKACGLALDLNAAGMGIRSLRYAMIVDNGTSYSARTLDA